MPRSRGLAAPPAVPTEPVPIEGAKTGLPRVTIDLPRPGTNITVYGASQDGPTSGFALSGHCAVPPGYQVWLATDSWNQRYWVLYGGSVDDCVADGLPHSWQANNVDPSYPNEPSNEPTKIFAFVLTTEQSESVRSQLDSQEAADSKKPIALPASVWHTQLEIRLTRSTR